MSETPVDMGMQSAAPSGSSPPQSGTPPQQPQSARGPDTRGHSPALDHREQQTAPGERMISIAGKDYAERDISDLLADKVQRDIVKQGLPAAPDKYEIKLPEGFVAPEGMAFEFNTSDPALQQFREFAHQKGLDAASFQQALGIFASTKLAEHQIANQARQAEMNKLGAAGPQRIDAIETWLRARVGDDASIAINTLRAYPVAANVKMFETIIRAFSSQGGHGVTQSGRESQEDAGKIPGYDKMSFIQRRVAQITGGDR